MIGEDIEILVKEVGRNHVRLGINAPRSVPIRRLETLDPPEPSETSEEQE